MKKLGLFLGIGLILVALGFVFVHFYEFIFARDIHGTIVGIERVIQPTAIIGGSQPAPTEQVFSFAVAIQDEGSQEIFTASSEDRQWAVVQKGQCAEAKFFPYAPWDLAKSGTFHGARLLKLYPCPK